MVSPQHRVMSAGPENTREAAGSLQRVWGLRQCLGRVVTYWLIPMAQLSVSMVVHTQDAARALQVSTLRKRLQRAWIVQLALSMRTAMRQPGALRAPVENTLVQQS